MKSPIAKYTLLVAFSLALLLGTSSNVQAAPPPQEADATLRIINDSDQTICHVLIFPVTSGEWGDNWLGEDETIPPGETRSLDLPSGPYNVLLADCEGNVLLAERNVVISELHELRFNTCKVLTLEGVGLLRQAYYPEALQKLRDALACYREIDDHAGEVTTLNNIGGVYYSLRQYEEALTYYEKALTTLQEIGDRAGEGTTLNNIGLAYDSLGQYEEALDYFEQALSIRQEIGDRAGEGQSLNNIGGIYYRLGLYQEALDYFEQALSIRQEIGDRAGEGTSLHSIGFIHASLRQYKEALDYFEQALSIRQEIGDQAGEGVSLHDIGFIYESLGLYQEALDYYEQALFIWQEVGDHTGEGVTLNNIGGVCDSLGLYQEALDYHKQALAIRQEIGDHAGESRSLNNIGDIYETLGQYEEALDYYEQALSIHQEIGDRAGEGVTLNTIGVIYHSLGQYEEASDYYEQALTIRQEIGDREGEGRSLNIIGVIYYRLGQYEEALGYCQQALSIWQEIGDHEGESRSLNNIGGIYAHLGKYQDALDWFEQALSIAQEIGDQVAEGASLNGIGAIYASLGQYEEALRYYKQALNTVQEIGDWAGEGTILDNIGFIYDRLGQYGEALDYYQQALSITQAIGDRAEESVSLNGIGVIYARLGQYEEALDCFERALSIRQEIGDQAGEAENLNNIGFIHDSLGQYEEALGYYQQALSILQEIGDRAWEGASLHNIGIIYDRLGQYEEALGCYQQTVAVVESMGGKMRVEEIKSSFAAEQAHVYDSIISLLIQMERPDDAFGYVQRAKARTFLDQLANVRIDPRATDAPQLLAREQELLGEIRILENVLSGRSDFAPLGGTTRGGPPPLTSEQHAEVQARLEAAYREYEQLLTQIKLTNPQYAGLRSVQASTLITVQQTLPPNVTLLEYYVAPTQTLAFAVTQDDFYVVPISVTRQTLNESVTWLRQFPSLEGVSQAFQELYDLLFAPIREHIHTSALFIAPHSILHYLPFGALHDSDHYLVEDYAIAYLPSASVFQYVLENVHDDTTGDLLALCNPGGEGAPYLNHAVAETKAIAALFDVQPIVGPEATETQLLEQAPQANLVHIAAHGEFKPFAPQFSRIYLASDDENDGYLEVREIFNLELPQADLVTLSACETQLGELSAGDELVGLSRAFIYAGTPSLVATLWSVDDESTRFLMERFYGYLQEGQGKALALRQAQLDTMEEYPSPYYWAPFTLIGEMGEREVIAPPGSIWLWVCGVALFTVVVSVGMWGWIQRKRKTYYEKRMRSEK